MITQQKPSALNRLKMALQFYRSGYRRFQQMPKSTKKVILPQRLPAFSTDAEKHQKSTVHLAGLGQQSATMAACQL
jgi:hypothetical protein